MLCLMGLALGIVAVAFAVAHFVKLRRTTSEVHQPTDLGVTLSVLPSRTAVITLELGGDPCSAAVASLVEHAVKEAFAFETVDALEVRDRDGHLLDRRSRGDARPAKDAARPPTSSAV